jgi:hypothetical protein
MLNLRENIKRLHLNQHQIEINMSTILDDNNFSDSIHNNPSIVVYFTVVMYILFLDFVLQDLELCTHIIDQSN